jgi:hypothetical protein
MAPFWYMLLAFLVLGMLVADLFELWRVVAYFLFRGSGSGTCPRGSPGWKSGSRPACSPPWLGPSCSGGVDQVPLVGFVGF